MRPRLRAERPGPQPRDSEHLHHRDRGQRPERHRARPVRGRRGTRGASQGSRRPDRSVDREATDTERYLRMLLERRVDGILTAAPQMERDGRIGELLRGPVPAVSIHRAPGGVSLVSSDHVETALLATRHLCGMGHSRVATVTGSDGRQVTSHRLRGYKTALAEADMPTWSTTPRSSRAGTGRPTARTMRRCGCSTGRPASRLSTPRTTPWPRAF